MIKNTAQNGQKKKLNCANVSRVYHEDSKKALFVTHYTGFHVSLYSPIYNLTQFLSQKGYYVEVVCIESYNGYGTDLRLRSIQLSKNTYISFVAKINNIIKDKVNLIISVDSRALITAYLANFLTRKKHIHLSLEIDDERETKTLKKVMVQYLSRWALKQTDKIIVQDKYRLQTLLGNINYDLAKAYFLPNSRMGFYTGGRQSYFNDKFNIAKDQVIVLCTGSLIAEHMIHDAIKSVANWPTRYVLIIHGWIPQEDYKKYLFDLASSLKGRIFFSTNLLPMQELDLIFSSVDIGLVLYQAVNDNFRFIGQAAGKVFDFMRTGVPMIINKATNAYAIPEELGCAIAVNECNEIPHALEKIYQKYEQYRKNCFESFEHFEQKHHLERLIESI